MYITAQHVVAPGTAAAGVNAFHYDHGPHTWSGLPPEGVPDRNPGTLVSESITLPPPGNRVRSYLDIVAPDETPWDEIRRGFLTFVGQAQRSEFPWIGVVGRTFFRIGMERALAQNWKREMANLYRAAQTVRVG